ncbi:MAG: hypothetical protein U0183_07230 [Polyangiaceae bacterium]
MSLSKGKFQVMIRSTFAVLVASGIVALSFVPGCGDDGSPGSDPVDAASPSPSFDSASPPPADAALPDAASPDGSRPDAGSRGALSILAGSSATGNVDGRGDAARFSGPSGGVVLPDRSAILLADTFNAVIRRVDLATRDVTTVAGRVQVQATSDGVGLAARFQSPRAMVAAPDGSAVYVADGPTLRKIALPSYAVTTIAGTPGQAGYADGTGATVRLGFLLHALEISADGKTLYVADRSNKCLRTVELATGAVATIAGAPYTGANQHVDAVGGAARFSGIGGITRVGTTLYLADTFNHVLRAVDLTTFAVSTIAGAAGMAGLTDGTGPDARFSSPQGVVVKGDYLYSTSFDGVLRRVRMSTFAVDTILGDSDDPRPLDGTGAAARLGSAFAQPMAHPTEDVLFYQDRSASSVRRVDLATLSVTTVAGSKDPEGTVDGPIASARFVSPEGLAANDDGSVVLVSDSSANVIRRIDAAAGMVSTLAGATDSPGSADGPAKDARFRSPGDLVWDVPKRRVFVADVGNHSVRVIDLATSAVTTLVGVAGSAGLTDGAFADARLASPQVLAFDAASETLYVAEAASSSTLAGGRAAIRVVDLPKRTVTTLAGGVPASPPVDGPLGTASFASIAGLGLDVAGKKLYVAESSRATIRVVDLAAKTVSLFAGKDNEKGPADGDVTAARFASPAGMAFAEGENALYVADTSSHTLRRIDVTSKRVTTWLGNPSLNGGLGAGTTVPFESASLYFPGTPTLRGGDLMFVSEHAVYTAKSAQGIRR